MLEDCKVFHFGSLSLTDEPARTATIEAVKIAKSSGALISYDPNYRASLWEKKETAVEQMKSMIPYVDVMKVSDEELVLLTGNKDYSQAVKILLDILLATKQRQEKLPGFKVKAIDTTGAGDSFWGGF